MGDTKSTGTSACSAVNARNGHRRQGRSQRIDEESAGTRLGGQLRLQHVDLVSDLVALKLRAVQDDDSVGNRISIVQGSENRIRWVFSEAVIALIPQVHELLSTDVTNASSRPV